VTLFEREELRSRRKKEDYNERKGIDQQGRGGKKGNIVTTVSLLPERGRFIRGDYNRRKESIRMGEHSVQKKERKLDCGLVKKAREESPFAASFEGEFFDRLRRKSVVLRHQVLRWKKGMATKPKRK